MYCDGHSALRETLEDIIQVSLLSNASSLYNRILIGGEKMSTSQRIIFLDKEIPNKKLFVSWLYLIWTKYKVSIEKAERSVSSFVSPKVRGRLITVNFVVRISVKGDRNKKPSQPKLYLYYEPVRLKSVC